MSGKVGAQAAPLLTASTLQNYSTIEEKSPYIAPIRDKNLGDDEDDDGVSIMPDDDDRTTGWETFLHLVKGYIGPGCLSLPWAVSQLGIPLGCLSLAVMSFWSSYNCWIVVKLKRYIERTQIIIGGGNGANNDIDAVSEAPSTATSMTYPEVGDWAYGRSFQSYVTACVCTQQLAICTVFLSFIGENILAVFDHLNIHFFSTHVGVITLALPAVLSLSFLPNLKTLAPVMAGGTIFLLLTFIALGTVIGMEWENRPDESPTIQAKSAPLAVCAILYSYEGICLILPVESAMKEPQHFQKIFGASMFVVAAILAIVSCGCVLTFGEVTNGSVTAFLIQSYSEDPKIIGWLMAANTLVSLSVLFTYPLQLFPALELLGPTIMQMWDERFNRNDNDNNVDDLLDGFEPLPALPEHETLEELSIGSLPSEHKYEVNDEGHEITRSNNNDDDADDNVSRGGMSSVSSIFPVMTMPGDSPQLRAGLVFLTYTVAVIVPNVQALISLAGALAGASTALLIPPVLELAWIKHLEGDSTTVLLGSHNHNNNTLAESRADDPLLEGSAAVPQRHDFNDDVDASRWWMASTFDPWGKWWKEKIKCYILLFFGLVFCLIGTYASLADIVRIYLGK